MITVRDNRLLLRGRTAGTQLSPLYIHAGQVVSELSEHYCALCHEKGLTLALDQLLPDFG